MSVRPFGSIDGQDVSEIILDNGEISCSVLTYGCVLRTLKVPSKEGGAVDVVLGYDDVNRYANLSGRMGAVIGRYANRIRGGRFQLNGETIQLTVNRPPNHIHGGNKGFDRKVWDILSCTDTSVTLGYRSTDGEEGYPGNMDVNVTYSLKGCSLTIRYEAVSDRDTVCSLTNHSYFNLSGKGDISDHFVSIDSDRFTPAGDDGIPTGEIANVSGEYDLRSPKRMSTDMRFDTNYMLDHMRQCAVCFSESTGIRMTVSTDMPAMQFYTGDGLKDAVGKNGSTISSRNGLCFETQFAPDSPNNPQFGDCVLKKGEIYDHRTTFNFDIA